MKTPPAMRRAVPAIASGYNRMPSRPEPPGLGR